MPVLNYPNKKLTLQRSLLFVSAVSVIFGLVYWRQHRAPRFDIGRNPHHHPHDHPSNHPLNHPLNHPHDPPHDYPEDFPPEDDVFDYFQVPDGMPPVQKFNETFTSEDVINPILMAQNTFLIIKTGTDVLHSRIPAHVESTLQWFPNHAVYADGSAMVNGVEVIDAISFLPQEIINAKGLEGYITRRESFDRKWGWGYNSVKVDGKNSGWSLDRVKNIPAFAHAFVNNPGFDWYVMIDGDTMLFPSTLSGATAGMNPKDPHYLGRDVGDHEFPHGGSGLLMSRGAMKAVYGETEESALDAVANHTRRALQDCCGDAAFSYMVYDYLEDGKKDLEYQTTLGYFQGGDSTDQKCGFPSWCKPIGTFHHIPNWEVQMLAKWYEKVLEDKGDPRYLPTYHDYYMDFIMPHVAEELPHWYMRSHKNPKFTGEAAEAKNKESCKKACVDRENCYAWSFRKVGDCQIFDYGVVAGKATNPASFDWKQEYENCVSGYMVDRIIEQRQNQICDPAYMNPYYNFREGWLAKKEYDPSNVKGKPLKDRY